MPKEENFKLLRKILVTLGLPKDGIDDIVDRITDWLILRDEEKSPRQKEYPYLIRDDFLSVAEISFYHVLRNAVSDWAVVCPKIPLSDLFYVKTSDNSKFRTYTNKIDRKHLDFLLCDPKSMRPLLGLELDDKSHQRKDRQERDDLVENIFKVTKLPLVRMPVRHTYPVMELNLFLQSALKGRSATIPSIKDNEDNIPKCPKCGSEMMLRTARSGANAGSKFWGCRNYPDCRGIVKFEE